MKLTCPLRGQASLHRAGSRWGGGKHIKGGSQAGLSPLLYKTLSCNQAVTLVHHFKSLLWQDRTKEITHSPNTIIVYLNANFSPVVLSHLVVSDSW